MKIIENILIKRSPRPKCRVLSPIAKRFSPRVFSQKEISNEHLQIILEAAKHAPSARNHQPWYFYIVKKSSQAYKKLFESIPKRNFWAKTAPLIIVACYDPTEENNNENRWAIYDLGASVMSLVLQAQELGIYCRQIGSFDWNKLKVDLPVADPYLPFVLVAIGKIGNEEDYQNADSEIVNKEICLKELKMNIFEELR